MAYRPGFEIGGMLTFNADHGMCEAVVRGYRSGFLTEVDYHHLTLCDTLEGVLISSVLLYFSHFCFLSDVKLNLQETDYSTFLQEEVRYLNDHIN